MAKSANSRATLGSIFAAVQASALTVGNTLDAVNAGVGMLNKAVEDAAKRQSDRSIVDMDTYRNDMIQEKALERAESRRTILDYCAQSQSHKDLFESAFNEINALFADKK